MLNKICVRLFGGLGNQLFIYAFGLANAQRSGKQLVIDDVSGFSHRDIYHAEFCLSAFSITGAALSKSKYKYLVANRYFWFLAKKLGLSHTEVDESKYDARAVNVSSGFFEGYWQSYLYFHEYKALIKSNLRLQKTNHPQILTYKEKILRSKNSVAIGMRFYDTFPGDAAIYDVKGTSYYSAAIKLLESKEKNLTYFVFSINIAKAKKLLSQYADRDIIFVDPLEGLGNAQVDLYLMTLCSHFVISNSTMYWWAAYLGEVDKSVVICPETGFSNRDALPPEWLKIKHDDK